jgi:hypothetical protein
VPKGCRGRKRKCQLEENPFVVRPNNLTNDKYPLVGTLRIARALVPSGHRVRIRASGKPLNV